MQLATFTGDAFSVVDLSVSKLLVKVTIGSLYKRCLLQRSCYVREPLKAGAMYVNFWRNILDSKNDR